MIKKYKHEFYYITGFLAVAIILELLGLIVLDGEERFIGYSLIIIGVLTFGSVWRTSYKEDS